MSSSQFTLKSSWPSIPATQGHLKNIFYFIMCFPVNNVMSKIKHFVSNQHSQAPGGKDTPKAISGTLLCALIKNYDQPLYNQVLGFRTKF